MNILRLSENLISTYLIPMSSGTTHQVTLSWECCPEEILWIILKHLGSKCLLSCMTVNRRWKYIVIDFIEFHRLWPKIVSENMVNMGLTYQRKSVLNFKDMLANSMLWPSVSLANIVLHHSYELQDITRMHVYKDNLILKTNAQVRYFHITNTKLTRTLEGTAKEIDYDYTENDYMVVVFGYDDESMTELRVYGKTDPDDISVNKDLMFVMKSILLYRLEDNICYVVTNRYDVWALIWNRKKWDAKSRGRYYGNTLDSICGIYVFNDRVSMVTKYGMILCEDPKSKTFQKQVRYTGVHWQHTPHLVLFNQTNIAVSVDPFPINRRIEVHELGSNHYMMLVCANMTCATEHGKVLFIGYRDGAVAICTPDIMSLTNSQPDRLLYVHDFDKSIENPCVMALEVFEDSLSHHLFVATRHKVLQLLITYPHEISAYYE